MLSQGIEDLGSTHNHNPLASRCNGRVDFTKIELTLSRLQPLFGRFSILVAVYGQYAFTPLLVSELCGYGGRVFGARIRPFAVRLKHLRQCWRNCASTSRSSCKGLTQAQLYGFRRPRLAPQYCPGSRHIQQCGCCLCWELGYGWDG